jgi:hypothetical protein
MFLVERLIEPGDAAATEANIRESEGLFRSGLVVSRSCLSWMW